MRNYNIDYNDNDNNLCFMRVIHSTIGLGFLSGPHLSGYRDVFIF